MNLFLTLLSFSDRPRAVFIFAQGESSKNNARKNRLPPEKGDVRVWRVGKLKLAADHACVTFLRGRRLRACSTIPEQKESLLVV